MTQEAASKKLKMAGPKIGTHNGTFHADEALAVYLLRLLPNYQSSPLVRTRDPALLSGCHTVVDVGGEYSPAANRYDHHQRSFGTTFPEHQTKLSSAGLVYMHFGRAIIAQHTQLPEDHDDVTLLYEKLYDDFIEAIDANDNGIAAYDAKDGVTKKFNDRGITLPSIVGDLNYEDDGKTQAEAKGQAVEDARFEKASKLMGASFMRKLKGAADSWLPARELISETYKKRYGSDPSGAIMVFPNGGAPWKEHLYAMEEREPKEPKVVYVLYPESADDKDSKWRVQAVPVSRDSFESRKPLKEEWRGVRDEDLSAKAGIGGCVFVHASGFIGGNLTKAGALEMAKQSLGT